MVEAELRNVNSFTQIDISHCFAIFSHLLAIFLVTLKDFTPDLQIFYRDISPISLTFRNSGDGWWWIDICLPNV